VIANKILAGMLGHPIQLCTRMRRFVLTRRNKSTKNKKCTKVPTGRVFPIGPLWRVIRCPWRVMSLLGPWATSARQHYQENCVKFDR
jgi:hypothetical protein